MLPTIFEIPLPYLGTLPVYSFGFSMLLCFLAAWKLLEKNLAAVGLDSKHAEPIILWAAIGGLFGARILSALSNFDGLINDPFGTLLSGAGFVFYGGLIGGGLSVAVYLKKEGLPMLKVGDLCAAPLALGYAVGRLGCQLSGDGDYGKVTLMPWGMNYKYGVVPTLEMVHPTPFYESVLAGIILFILSSKIIHSVSKYYGQLFAIYLFLSGLTRVTIEFLRVEPKVWYGFTQAQVIGVIICIIAGFLWKFAPYLASNGLQEPTTT